MTIAAVAALVLGSWLVATSASGSTKAHGTGAPALRHDKAGHAPVSSTSHAGATVTSPQTTGAVAPDLAGSSSSSTPSTTDPVASTTSPTPPTTGPVPFTASPAPATTGALSVAPALAAPSVPATHASKRRKRASVAALAPSTGTAQVAAGLIGAINQRSGRQGAIPKTADNLGLLGRWMANEGGLWADNPLNTSLDSAAYPHQFTSSGQDTGIPIFPDLSVGLSATAMTILSNPAYSQILKVLRSGRASCMAFARVVIQSPWASGHYDHDPTGFCTGQIVPVLRGRQHRHGG